jgi:hypothetical protein
LAVDLASSQISTLAGQSGVPGGTDGAGSGATFNGPLGIAADGIGNLYVADDSNETVRKIVIATGTVSTIAGQSGIQGSNDGVGAAAHFFYPTGIAADGAGDVFVSDLENNVVRHIDVASGRVTTVIGSLTVAGVRLGPLPAQLTQPGPLALTPSGNLLLVSENTLLVAR